MNKHFILLCLLLSYTWALAQSCPPGAVTFITQADVDNFPINYPGCTEIDGSVYLLNSSSIQHLDGLSQIEHIHGDLLISGNEQLLHLGGLANLKTIGLACRIQNNPLLTNLDGLERLSAVKGDFFYIGNNASLLNIEGLADLDSISGIFHLWGNPQMVSLKGLGQLQKTGGNLSIFNMAKLAKLEGLDSLSSVGLDLRLEDNPLLTDISSLNHPVNIQAALVITNNPLLSNCAVKAVCDYLPEPATFVAISGNGSNCQSVQAVETACLNTSAWSPELQDAVSIIPNPTTGLVQVSIDRPDFQIIRVLDIAGRHCNIIRNQDATLDLSQLRSGTYWLEIGHPEGRALVPLIKI
jgi:hypothetical protein